MRARPSLVVPMPAKRSDLCLRPQVRRRKRGRKCRRKRLFRLGTKADIRFECLGAAKDVSQPSSCTCAALAVTEFC